MNNGYIQLTDIDVIIEPALSEDDFLNSELGADADPQMQGLDYPRYEIGRHAIKNVWFDIALIFHGSALKLIHLVRVEDPISIYSEETILEDLEQTAKTNKQWLQREFDICPPASFDWGTIEILRDTRSLSVSILLKFNRNNETVSQSF